ncbi:hypothetical protein QQZ08_001293 [Neonectria magnoliae]|uniref:GH16 domain-containing protein n=1 Tax=Neonectria magnoliae TaxID=2732573 RepID=A0ABR1IGK6_9HYPO
MLQYAVALIPLFLLPCAHSLSRPHSLPRNVLDIDIPIGFSSCLFYDDFSDQPPGSSPSSQRWTFDLGTSYPGGPANWGNGEAQHYTSDQENIHITEDKTLRITPIRGYDGNWTSSRIETTKDWDFGCKRGQRVRIEARIKLGDDPKEKQMGIWPAFWALGSDFRGNYTNWPSIGEIDIMESLNGEPKTWQVVHCGTAPGGPCNEFNGIGHTTDSVERGVWHTFAWEVDRRLGLREESMSWFIDGVRQWGLTQSNVDDQAAWQALAGNKKMLLLNVAVGGTFPDAVAGVKTPTNATIGGEGASMEVDYVAAYAWF